MYPQIKLRTLLAVPGTVIVTPSKEYLLGFSWIGTLIMILEALYRMTVKPLLNGPLWRGHLSNFWNLLPMFILRLISIQRSSPLGGRGSPSWYLNWLNLLCFPSIYYTVTCFDPKHCDVLTRRKRTQPYPSSANSS